MRTVTSFLLIILPVPIFADQLKAHLGMPYAEPEHQRQMLDVYAAPKAKDQPVVLWIHGGGWRAGDRSSVQKKPQAFVDKGFVFVATNHRFFPNVTVKEMLGDIAKAIRWVHDHAKEYGGDPKSIFVMGHSSGAHLAALVCTDDRYLKAEGLPLSIIKGCVPVDVSVYDIPKRIKDGGSVAATTFTNIFGEKEDSQRDYSPAAHVAKGKSIPPFLILHVADRPETKTQSNWFADKLKDAGISANVVAAEGTTHGTINANLGLPSDKPTLKMWEFMNAAMSKMDPALSEQVDKLKKLGAKITLDDRNRVICVNFSERKITDADLVHLKGLQHLQELDLTRTKITSAGLSNLKDLSALSSLYLTETKVDDSGIAHLKGMKSLGLIGVSGTKITDEALDHLGALTGLRQIFCLGTAVTDVGVAKFQQKRSECRVTR